MNFRQGLSSILHFRQYKLPNSESGEKLTPENAQIPMNLRQGIASPRGKEIVQVTLPWETSKKEISTATRLRRFLQEMHQVDATALRLRTRSFFTQGSRSGNPGLEAVAPLGHN